jgi:hypothetical protein
VAIGEGAVGALIVCAVGMAAGVWALPTGGAVRLKLSNSLPSNLTATLLSVGPAIEIFMNS